ncbi:UNVERIFIED_CONTAM: hypothetical protein PYX00_006439 [Menopon gallinae]|uniref:Secreted protein n=1 Tax=Menopon gallinae TaxID=328185 RepID=A0AAW2HVQ4_9NEOP
MWACVLCALIAASSAVPIVEIRTGDTERGPQLELVAVPIVREVTVPEATIFVPEQYLAAPTCPATTEAVSADGLALFI